MGITMDLPTVFRYLIIINLVCAGKISKKSALRESIKIMGSFESSDSEEAKESKQGIITEIKKNVDNKNSSDNNQSKKFLGKVEPLPNLDLFGLAAHPQPYPTEKPDYVMSPYKSIYQGLRYKNDTRIFRKKFEHEAMEKGQHIVSQGVFDCVISHIAIETSEGIPVLLRGGAGYRHFMAVVKAKPHHDLKGQVRAYCRSNYAPPDEDKPINGRRFYFGNKLAEKNLS